MEVILEGGISMDKRIVGVYDHGDDAVRAIEDVIFIPLSS